MPSADNAHRHAATLSNPTGGRLLMEDAGYDLDGERRIRTLVGELHPKRVGQFTHHLRAKRIAQSSLRKTVDVAPTCIGT
jgi:hypothetical protein